MKVRLTGITEEPVYLSLPVAEPTVESSSIRATMARFDVINPPTPTSYTTILVPYLVVKGAQVGDEFTLHLERVRK
jgi:hypothetical protein